MSSKRRQPPSHVGNGLPHGPEMDAAVPAIIHSLNNIQWRRHFLLHILKGRKPLLEACSSDFPSGPIDQDWITKLSLSPDWCNSVGWAPACELRGHWFDSQSGHRPCLRARSPAGECVRGSQWMFLLYMDVSLPLVLPLSLSKKINKI